MLLLSPIKHISNIADISHFGVELIQSPAEKCSFLQISKGSAYLLKPKHIEAYEHQTLENHGQNITYGINKWRQDKKLNSGEKMQLIVFLK